MRPKLNIILESLYNDLQVMAFATILAQKMLENFIFHKNRDLFSIVCFIEIIVKNN